MPRVWFIKPCIFLVFTVVASVTGSPARLVATDAAPSLEVTRDKEKTVYVINGGPKGEETQDTANAWNMLHNLAVDTRGQCDKDHKAYDRDER